MFHPCKWLSSHSLTVWLLSMPCTWSSCAVKTICHSSLAVISSGLPPNRSEVSFSVFSMDLQQTASRLCILQLLCSKMTGLPVGLGHKIALLLCFSYGHSIDLGLSMASHSMNLGNVFFTLQLMGNESPLRAPMRCWSRKCTLNCGHVKHWQTPRKEGPTTAITLQGSDMQSVVSLKPHAICNGSEMMEPSGILMTKWNETGIFVRISWGASRLG